MATNTAVPLTGQSRAAYAEADPLHMNRRRPNPVHALAGAALLVLAGCVCNLLLAYDVSPWSVGLVLCHGAAAVVAVSTVVTLVAGKAAK